MTDFLWSPWRAAYVSGQSPGTGCVFCRLKAEPELDDKRHVLHRGRFNFVVLNLYPYTSGHLLIAPYEHLSRPSKALKPATDEMMDLAIRAELALEAEYGPDGFNLGMNLGRAAGAGVADHYHLHVLPRWIGDANFTTTVGETRVLSENLSDTYRKLKRHFRESA
ncbi:MAG: HIT domain-containing protein [Acidobacteria bacterium]|nr:HIT domain-containing protein [Acidobacteriota bacterium]MCW5970931.1 HIT domain-containing protein [Blastocatellales bacterium]